jgi:4-aminobutyrate aminotransferase-like enzyme
MQMPMTRLQNGFPERGGPIQVFYTRAGGSRRPTVARAEGICMWDTEGRRYIDASSGPVATNIGHGNPRVLRAMMEQAQKVWLCQSGGLRERAQYRSL